jgi:hypothetical protein
MGRRGDPLLSGSFSICHLTFLMWHLSFVTGRVNSLESLTER